MRLVNEMRPEAYSRLERRFGVSQQELTARLAPTEPPEGAENEDLRTAIEASRLLEGFLGQDG